MELQEKIYQLGERIKELKVNICTEEATKQSFILPFFQALGYDVFNPLEFVPEFTADVGIKKKEKVDYAIMLEGEPIILIEAKPCHEKLDKHDSQLFRYFGTTSSKFAILTNGIIYKFYSDLDQPNIMDSQPFFILDMENLSEQSVKYLDFFIKSNLDIENILDTANDLKYVNLVKAIFNELLNAPTDEFIKFLLNSGIYDGVKNQKTIDKFRPIIKKGLNQFINEKMSSKFKATLSQEEEPIDDMEDEETNKIVTTFDELNAYAIVKSILRKDIECNRITYRDTENYFGILLDDNNRKWICRIKLDTAKKHIIISDDEKKGIRYDIENLDDIYRLENELISSASKYL